MRFPDYFTEDCFQEETELSLFQKVQALLQSMTIEEKANLCHGGLNPTVPGQIGNGGYIKGVPRLGVPEIRMYDGPAGVTSKYETTGLPAEELLASTFSRELAYEFGKVSGSENRMVAGNCQLGAEVDLVRTTHFNRTRDMLGEDPYLASELAVPLVRGIQDEHVIATLKHFAGYVVPSDPANSPDMMIDEQTMHELYLKTFERAIKKGGAAGVMTSYGRINGSYASDSRKLLIEVLREEWNFAGLTMSDWGANHSFSVNRGLDIEMPAGAYNSTERIFRFIESGKLRVEELDAAAGHVLYAMGRVGYLSLVRLDDSGQVIEEAKRTEPIRIPDTYAERVDLREHNAKTARNIVEKGAVLLKNERKTLPLLKEDYSGEGRTALIGLGAKYPICGYGQERSYGTLRHMTSPFDELREKTGSDGNLACEAGIDLVGDLIPESVLFVDKESRKTGLTRYYGISEKDGFRPPLMSMGGAGEEFHGVAAPDAQGDDEDENLDFVPLDLFMPSSDAADMDGFQTGEVCGIDSVISFTCGTGLRNYKNQEDGTAFVKGDAYTWKGYLEAPEDGEYQMNLQAIGGVAVLKMDTGGSGFSDIGMVKLREGTQWPWGNLVSTREGMEVCATRVRLEKGRRYPILVYGKALLEEKDFQIRLAWRTPAEQAADYARAVKLAAQSNKVILFIHSGFKVASGRANGALSFTEGIELRLEEMQKKLLSDVSGAVHNNGGTLAVIAYNGSAFAMKEWIDEADALMYLWMPGQGGAKALARLLTGEISPSGKLPQTFPNDNEDTLISDTKEHFRVRWEGISEEGKPSEVTATEGIFTGYRWYEREGRKPLFPFGYGLSYTSFAYTDFEVCEKDGTVRVMLSVQNTGSVCADEVVQVYLGAGEVPPYAMMASKQLCGFVRLEDIRPGECRHVEIPIEEEALMYWDVLGGYQEREDGTKDKWKRSSGLRKIMVGTSSADIRFEQEYRF